MGSSEKEITDLNDDYHKDGLQGYADGNGNGKRSSSPEKVTGTEQNPIRKYYREISVNAYLSRENEFESFKTLTEAKAKTLEAVITSPFTIGELIELGRKLKMHEIKIKEVLGTDPLDEMNLMGTEKKRELVLSTIEKIEKKDKELTSYLKALKKCKEGGRKSEEIKRTLKKCHEGVVKLVGKIPFNQNQLDKLGQKVTEIAAIVLSQKEKKMHPRKKAFLHDQSFIGDNEKWIEFLSTDNIQEMIKNIREGRANYKKTKLKLVKANLRFVISVARRFENRGLELLDLIQEGNIGLMAAIDKFDHKREIKFCSYGHWWIQQTIMKALLEKAKTIRIPVHIVEDIKKMKIASKTLSQGLKRKPTVREIAEKVMVSEDFVRRMLKIQKEPISLDKVLENNDNESALIDYIEDVDSPSPDNELCNKEVQKMLREILKCLSPREEKILRMRYGIDFNMNHTLGEIGEDFALSRERIRQIEEKAIAKLRKKEEIKKLKSLLN